MATINISLPDKQADSLDLLIEQYGFASRSELVRSLIRLVSQRPSVLEEASVQPFASPAERSVSTIVAGFARTKKYSKAFLKDLEEGLSSSSYFTK